MTRKVGIQPLIPTEGKRKSGLKRQRRCQGLGRYRYFECTKAREGDCDLWEDGVEVGNVHLDKLEKPFLCTVDGCSWYGTPRSYIFQIMEHLLFGWLPTPPVSLAGVSSCAYSLAVSFDTYLRSALAAA